MANEFVARKGLIISGSTRASGSITAFSFTGSIFGTSSHAVSSSYAPNLYITASDSPPASPDINELWYDSTTGKTYIYYRSASVLQWVLQADPTYDPGPSIQDLQDVTDVGSSTTNAIVITNTTTAIDSSSGALIVSGGVGIKGALYANTVNANTVTATSFVGTATTASYVTFANVANKPALVSSSAQINTGSFTGSFIGVHTGSLFASTGSIKIDTGSIFIGGVTSSDYPLSIDAARYSGNVIELKNTGTVESAIRLTNGTPALRFSVKNNLAAQSDNIVFAPNNVDLISLTTYDATAPFTGKISSQVQNLRFVNVNTIAFRNNADTSHILLLRNDLSAAFSGSVSASVFTGSFIGNLTGTGSWANSASIATTASFVLPSGLPSGVVSSSTQFTSLTAPFTGSFTGSFVGPLTGTSSYATNAGTATTVTTNTVSYTAGAGLSGGGTATLGGASVTIDAVAGAGISLTAPTNDAINIDTSSAHFTGGVKTRLNTEGVISSSTQFTSLTAPFTGSFTGSLRGNLIGTGSWANTASVAVSSSYALTASYALNGGTGTAGNSFVTFSIAGQNDVIADSANDTMTLVAGSGITLTTNASTDSITIAATAADPQAFNIDTYEFIGDGTTVNYNVVNSYNINSLAVSVDGLTYTPSDDYTISTNTLTFVTSPPSQSNILVRAFVNATTGVTGSFTGSFFGVISTASFATTASFAVSASWSPGGAGTVTSVTAGSGLSGGTITNAGTIALDTSSAHFLDGVKKELNTEGVISSSTQFTSLTAPFTGSFTGSFRGSLIGTSSWADSASRATTASFAVSASWAPGASATVGPGTVNRFAFFDTSTTVSSSNIITSGENVIITGSTPSLAVGRATPAYELDVNGALRVGGTSPAVDAIIIGTNALASYIESVGTQYFNLQMGTRDAFSIGYSTGNVSIDVNQNPDLLPNKLNIKGNVTASSYTSSVANGIGYLGTSSWAQSSSVAVSSSYALSASYAPGGSGTVTQIVAGAGLTGGTITNSGTITLDTSSVHFLDGVKKELNTEGVISSSTQFISLTAPFTGSFTGSFRGGLIGTSSWADSASRAVTSSFVLPSGLPAGTISSSTQFTSLTAPFTGSFTGSFKGNFSGSLDRFNPSTLKITVGTTAPTSPSVNDLWVDTN